MRRFHLKLNVLIACFKRRHTENLSLNVYTESEFNSFLMFFYGR